MKDSTIPLGFCGASIFFGRFAPDTNPDAWGGASPA